MENSTFNLKNKIRYYRKIWFKKNIFKIFLGIGIWIAAMLILKFNDGEHLMGYFAGLLLVLIFSLLQNNMNLYVEKNINNKNSSNKDYNE